MSGCYSNLGCQEEALTVIQDGVALFRALAKACPEASNQDLADSFVNLAACYSNLGRHKEALIVYEENMALNRELAKARPKAFNGTLAMSLGNLSKAFIVLLQTWPL